MAFPKNFKPLSHGARAHLSSDQFAVPDERKFPIKDKAHAELALKWSKGTKYAGEVASAVHKKYGNI